MPTTRQDANYKFQTQWVGGGEFKIFFWGQELVAIYPNKPSRVFLEIKINCQN